MFSVEAILSHSMKTLSTSQDFTVICDMLAIDAERGMASDTYEMPIWAYWGVIWSRISSGTLHSR